MGSRCNPLAAVVHEQSWQIVIAHRQVGGRDLVPRSALSADYDFRALLN